LPIGALEHSLIAALGQWGMGALGRTGYVISAKARRAGRCSFVQVGGTSSDPLMLRLLIQLQDAASSAASNYTSACRAQSKAAFVAKLSIALEEADESVGWLQRLSNHGIGDAPAVARLLQEAGEISAILNASRQTATGLCRRPRKR
jgi:four helix bundle protein